MIDFEALAAPFPPDRVSWRAQTVFERNGETKALALAYIDARDVMERLDEVCGPQRWQRSYPHANGKTVCSIGIKVGDEWVWKADGAGDTDIEAEKGALSDAFKRAAVSWGIGRYLYDVGDVWVPCEAYKGNDGKWKFKKFTDDPLKHVRSGPLKASAPPAPKQPAKAAVPTTPLPAGMEPAPDRPEVADYLQKVAMLLDVCDTNEEIDEVLKAGASQRKSIGLVEGSPSWSAFKSIVELGRQAVKVPA